MNNLAAVLHAQACCAPSQPSAWRRLIKPAPESEGSFPDLVDRTLADLREILVSEHSRLLNGNGLRPISGGNSIAAHGAEALPVRAVEQQPAVPASGAGQDGVFQLPTSGRKLPTALTLMQDKAPAAATVVECGTQTQVYCALPVMGTVAPPALVDKDVVEPEKSDPWSRPPPTVHYQEAKGPMPDTSGEDISGAKLPRASTLIEFQKRREEQAELAFSSEMHVDSYGWKRLVARAHADPVQCVDTVMTTMIFVNTACIAASSDTRESTTLWLAVDSVFATLFSLEILFKMYLKTPRVYFWGREWHWAWFEAIVVILSIFEIVTAVIFSAAQVEWGSVLRIVRLVRIVKVLRVARVPMATELVMMVNGAIGGARTLFWALVLICFPIFVVALVFRETLGEEPPLDGSQSSFDSVGKAFFNTFRCVVAGDCADETGRPIFVLACAEHGWFYGIIYSLAYTLMQIGLFNVIIAIFVEHTVEAAKYNELYQKRLRLTDDLMFQEKSLEISELAYSLKKQIPLELVASQMKMEEIQALELSRAEFNNLCGHSEFRELLQSLDVADEDHLDLFDTLDVDGGGTLDIGEIVSGISKLRGDARKSDIVAVILLAKHLSRSLSEFKADTSHVLEWQCQHIIQQHKELVQMMQAFGAAGS